MKVSETMHERMLISTDRLTIGEFDESMIQSVHKNSLDEDNRRFVPDEVFETMEVAAEVVEWLMGAYEGDEGPFVYPVLLRNGENIGYVQAVPLGDEWEIGYHIAKAHAGSGYATEAVSAFLPEMMERLAIDHIWGITLAENVASHRVLEKCGFVLEDAGIAAYQGHERDVRKYLYRDTRCFDR